MPKYTKYLELSQKERTAIRERGMESKQYFQTLVHFSPGSGTRLRIRLQS